MPTKILVIGCCAMDGELVAALADQGLMPSFAALRARGAHGRIAGMPGYYINATWPSFFTGLLPARHGCYYVTQIRPGSYELDRTPRALRVQAEPLWITLSRAGLRSAVLDVPHTVPRPDLNGVQLVEWGAHDFDMGRTLGAPDGFAAGIVDRFGRHPVDRLCDGRRDSAGFVAFRDALRQGVATKAAITRHVLDRENWDFFMQVFTEGHCIGHQCWHLHDRAHPAYDAAFVAAFGDPVVDVYRSVDAAIGEILEAVDADTVVLVVLSTGMGPSYSLTRQLGEILLRLGYSAPASEVARPNTLRRLWRPIDPIATRVWQMLPAVLRQRLAPARGAIRELLDETAVAGPAIDRSASACFQLPTDFRHGGIRFNVVGREPKGKVRRGAELDALQDELEAAILAIVNVETGRPVVARIIRTREHYDGHSIDHLPDLMLEWDRSAPIRNVASPAIGTFSAHSPSSRSGNHRPDGMFFAKGPGIERGSLAAPVSIVDFAPTLLRRFGLARPDLDGRVIAAIAAGARVAV